MASPVGSSVSIETSNPRQRKENTIAIETIKMPAVPRSPMKDEAERYAGLRPEARLAVITQELALCSFACRVVEAMGGMLEKKVREQEEGDAIGSLAGMMFVVFIIGLVVAANCDWVGDEPVHAFRVLFGLVGCSVALPLLLYWIGKQRSRKRPGPMSSRGYTTATYSPLPPPSPIKDSTDTSSLVIEGANFAGRVILFLLVAPVLFVLLSFGVFVGTSAVLGIAPGSPQMAAAGLGMAKFAWLVALTVVSLLGVALFRKPRPRG